jgi:hypothetical protein
MNGHIITMPRYCGQSQDETNAFESEEMLLDEDKSSLKPGSFHRSEELTKVTQKSHGCV